MALAVASTAYNLSTWITWSSLLASSSARVFLTNRVCAVANDATSIMWRMGGCDAEDMTLIKSDEWHISSGDLTPASATQLGNLLHLDRIHASKCKNRGLQLLHSMDFFAQVIITRAFLADLLICFHNTNNNKNSDNDSNSNSNLDSNERCNKMSNETAQTTNEMKEDSEKNESDRFWVIERTQVITNYVNCKQKANDEKTDSDFVNVPRPVAVPTGLESLDVALHLTQCVLIEIDEIVKDIERQHRLHETKWFSSWRTINVGKSLERLVDLSIKLKSRREDLMHLCSFWKRGL